MVDNPNQNNHHKTIIDAEALRQWNENREASKDLLADRADEDPEQKEKKRNEEPLPEDFKPLKDPEKL